MQFELKMGNNISQEISEEEQLIRLLAIQLETDDILLNEILKEENSIEEQDALRPNRKKTRIVYDRPDYRKSTWWNLSFSLSIHCINNKSVSIQLLDRFFKCRCQLGNYPKIL